MRGDCISLNGRINPIIQTPNLDSLAKEGFAFTNCFTVNPVCVPSRIAAFTGQYVHSSGHRSLYHLIQPHEENLLRLLKKKGYNVVYIGRNDTFSKEAFTSSVTKRFPIKFGSKLKINPYSEGHYLRKSFYFGERTKEEAKDGDYYIIKQAIEYINSEVEKPFCLIIALSFPHPPYTVEEPYFSMYNRADIPDPIPPRLKDKPKFMNLIHERYGLNKLKKEDFKEIIATYYGMITKVDHQFGQIFNTLKRLGAYNNTAVFFFGDHGDYVGDYGLTEKWPNAFQDCLTNVPLIMKLPNINIKNKIFDILIENVDLFPTILDVAQVKTKYTHFGTSIVPFLKGQVNIHRNAVFAEGGYDPREPQCFEPVINNPQTPYFGIYFYKTNIPKEDQSTVARSVMIRTKKWKLIIRTQGKEELYNLENDPDENFNIIEDKKYQPVIADLKEQLLRWYLQTSDNSDWKRERLV
jgi:arylsulfatase A-like enzyme